MAQTKRRELIEKLKVKGWTFSDEREFLENLFVGRFNHFLIVFSLFMTAGLANSFSELRYIVFYSGSVILIACWLPLIRGYKKLDIILRIVFHDKEDHPASIINKLLEKEGFRPCLKINKWMGIYIPGLCIMVLLMTGLLINIGYVK